MPSKLLVCFSLLILKLKNIRKITNSYRYCDKKFDKE